MSMLFAKLNLMILSLLTPTLQIQLLLLEARKITIANNCSYTVWPAASGWSLPTNFSLQHQQSMVVDLQIDLLVSLWGRTQCHTSTGKFACLTGDCGSGKMDCSHADRLNATTVVVIILGSNEDGDSYQVSLENGYNLAISVAPDGGSGSSCRVTGCVFDVSGSCPAVLRHGGVCRDPCEVFKTFQYCCTAGECGPTNCSQSFKKACPRASSYSMDNTSSFACEDSPPYTVTFCPSSTSIVSELSKPFQAPLSPSPSQSPAPLPLPLPRPGKRGITHAQPHDTDFRKAKRRQFQTSVLVVVSTSAAILMLSLGIWICMNKRKAKKRCDEEIDEIKTMESLQFDINTIRIATDNFSIDNKLGEGGFGEVYKGKLESGQEVAVKRLIQNSKQGVVEFKTKIVLVAKLQHKNLVKLLGFCVTSKEKILIYEFLCNSSLDRFLFDLTSNAYLDWQTRLNIILGIARGLLYLHEDSRLKVIHRDLKTSNILLDEAMNPKISDFGLAKLFEEDQTQDDTKRIVGTRAYMAPEYVITKLVNTQ